VPQRDRRPRTIVDYTFSDVNAETARLCRQGHKELPTIDHARRCDA
jgi:hypothetical protein